MTPIDLNADLGELPELLAQDLDLLSVITSANIACGGHAGDAASMARMVSAAARLGVAVGAHPSYPDPAGFGRAEMPMPEADLQRCIAGQGRALRQVADAHGVALRHVKPHGALYHAARRAEVARALASAVADVDPGLVMVGQAGSPALLVWSAMGLAVAPEAFADRRYEPDGSLRARSRPGAVLESPEDAARQAVRIATGLGVVAGDGSVVPVAARTVCLHSDSPDAPAIARAVRAALQAAGVPVRGPAVPTPRTGPTDQPLTRPPT